MDMTCLFSLMCLYVDQHISIKFILTIKYNSESDILKISKPFLIIIYTIITPMDYNCYCMHQLFIPSITFTNQSLTMSFLLYLPYLPRLYLPHHFQHCRHVKLNVYILVLSLVVTIIDLEIDRSCISKLYKSTVYFYPYP